MTQNNISSTVYPSPKSQTGIIGKSYNNASIIYNLVSEAYKLIFKQITLPAHVLDFVLCNRNHTHLRFHSDKTHSIQLYFVLVSKISQNFHLKIIYIYNVSVF